MLEFYEPRPGYGEPKRRRLSLRHRDREKAKQQADEAAARLGKREALKPAEITLKTLFDIYLGEVTPKNSQRHQKYDRIAGEMFKRYFCETVVSTLSRREWERFIGDRSDGRVGPGAGPWKPVGHRTVQKDLSFLRSVLNWATMAGDGRGGALLERDPFKGLRLPREKNPLRVVLTDDEYGCLLSVSEDVDWRFRVALVLAHETGHRIGAIRKLRWSDADLDERRMLWRAEHEKTGYEHLTPLRTP